MGHVTWSRSFQGRFVIRRRGLAICNPHIKYEILRLRASKKWQATPNVKILVLSYPLGDLRITHRVHLWLDGKRIVDFLISDIWTFLASSNGCPTIKRNLSKSAFSDGGGSVWVQILGRSGRPNNSSMDR